MTATGGAFSMPGLLLFRSEPRLLCSDCLILEGSSLLRAAPSPLLPSCRRPSCYGHTSRSLLPLPVLHGCLELRLFFTFFSFFFFLFSLFFVTISISFLLTLPLCILLYAVFPSCDWTVPSFCFYRHRLHRPLISSVTRWSYRRSSLSRGSRLQKSFLFSSALSFCIPLTTLAFYRLTTTYLARISPAHNTLSSYLSIWLARMRHSRGWPPIR